MNELSLFTGAGGGLLGTKLLGFNHIGYVEINEYCQKIIAQRIKDGILDEAPIFGDIRTFISEGYAESYQGMVDVITGGFPCQDISAGNQNATGIEGERSSLWNEMAEIIRRIGPKYVFVENSPMLTIRGLGVVLRDLATLGFDVKWCVLGASDIGGPHERKRIWIKGWNTYSNGERLEESANKNRLCNKTKKRGDGRRFSEMGDKVLQSKIWVDEHPTPASDARVADGLANRSHRLKAAGNGQIPAVVATAWRLLNDSK